MIVIPMAGEGQRFKDEGFQTPKFMLEIGSKSLFEWSVGSFSSYFSNETFLFVLRDDADSQRFVEQKVEDLGIQDVLIQSLTMPTKGQAETVYKGLKMANWGDESLTIFNIDTIRPDFTHPAIMSTDSFDGYLEVFSAAGDHWSFVKPDSGSPKLQAVAEVAEKVRISDLCSTGLYFFRSSRTFLTAYEHTYGENWKPRALGEKFVSPIYNTLIEWGADIRYQLVAGQSVIPSGTPSEYRAAKLTLAN